jgi:hypothetical protein
MKEMPIFEEVFKRMSQMPGFWLKLLIGGLLSFVPIVNVFAFGYLYRLAQSVRRSGQLSLPEWGDWAGLFIDGLKFAVVWAAYWLLPVLLAMGISWVLALISLGALCNVFFLTCVLLATVLFSAALYRYNMREDFKDLLDLSLILRMARLELPHLILPLLVFVGLCVLLMPFYGFSLFSGFLLLITVTSLRYRSLERKQTTSF